MRVEHVSFGPFANASEERAYNHLARGLRAEPGNARFVILTNVAHAVTGGGQTDEIDIIVVGASGVHVVEVKHWDRAYAKSHGRVVADEADKIASKARKVAGKVRRRYPSLGFVAAKMLLTKEQRSLQRETDEPVHGVSLYALGDWRKLMDLNDLSQLPEARIDELCEEIAPRSRAVLTGDLRRLGHITDLALLSPREDRFHRVYRGRSSITQDRLITHVYDLSAFEHENLEHLARREFQVVQRLQKSPWLPTLVDSFQPVPNYPGELFFFSLADSDSPALRTRTDDLDWPIEARLDFARRCLIALDELHTPPGDEEAGVVHRTITPDAILVRPDNRPLFFHWEWAKIAETLTIAGARAAAPPEFSAPEVLSQGLAAADRRSDTYALCASLKILFDGIPREEARQAVDILSRGTAADPGERLGLATLQGMFGDLATKQDEATAPAKEAAVAARSWAEDQEVTIDGHRYRIVGKLGAGGAGQTFKLQQFDQQSGEEFGTYVAKVVSNPVLGAAALRSYKQARPHTKHTNLTQIYTTAVEWQQDAALALLEWVEGTPLGDYAGVLELYAEELGESDVELLLLTWVRDLCGALARFHEVGLVHGDVSPANIIVNGSAVTLIDYDLVTKVGAVAAGSGTPPYASPTVRQGGCVIPGDDLFALAASLFHVLADRDPFLFDGVRAQDRGLAWPPVLRETFPRLARFLDRSVSLHSDERLPDALAARAFLMELPGEATTVRREAKDGHPLPLTPNEVPWLQEVLTAYPGSRYGKCGDARSRLGLLRADLRRDRPR